MALQDALRFLQLIRHTPDGLARLQATAPDHLACALTRMGLEAGCVFTLEELQAAFARDCTMRWLRYASLACRPHTG
jgi:hypothetical protein